MAQATTQVPEKTLSLSQRLAKEKRTSAFDWLTVYLWKDNDFFHAYNQSAYIIVNQLYTGEIKEQNNNRPLKVAKYRTSEGNYILAGFPVRSLNKYVSTSNLQRVVEDCVEIAVPASIIDKSIDELNNDYEEWTKTLTDINLCKFQPKKRDPQQQYKYQGPIDETQNQSSLQQQNGQENYSVQRPPVAQEQPANPMYQSEQPQYSRQATSTYYKKPYSSDYWGNYHQKNQSSWNNGGGYYSNGYQKPTWKFASYWNKEEQNQATQPVQQQYASKQYQYGQQQYASQYNQPTQQYNQQYQYSQPVQQSQQQMLPSSYTMFDLIRDIIRFQPEMTSPNDAMSSLIGLKQKVNRFLI